MKSRSFLVFCIFGDSTLALNTYTVSLDLLFKLNILAPHFFTQTGPSNFPSQSVARWIQIQNRVWRFEGATKVVGLRLSASYNSGTDLRS